MQRYREAIIVDFYRRSVRISRFLLQEQSVGGFDSSKLGKKLDEEKTVVTYNKTSVIHELNK